MSAVTRAAPTRLPDLLPGLGAAVSFSVADVLGKVVFASGMDVLSLVTLRGVLAAAFFWWWLHVSPPRLRHNRRQRWVAIGLGVLFSANIFGLLLAIKLLPLSIAILAYFVYPLLTGLAGAVFGIERLSWRSFLTALTAFGGLALMLGAQPSDLPATGIIAALAGAVFRVISLLLTRAELQGTDARATTWYSLGPVAVIFVVISLLVGEFNTPDSWIGWAAFIGMSISTTLSTFLIYVSTDRVGPFRTALLMNLEPVLSSCFSFAFLDEPATLLQLSGGAIMVAAICAFQFRR